MFRGLARAAVAPRASCTIRGTSVTTQKPFSTTSLLRQPQEGDDEARSGSSSSSPPSAGQNAEPSSPLNTSIAERPKPRTSPATTSLIRDLKGPPSLSSSSSKSASKGADSEGDMWASLLQLATTSSSPSSTSSSPSRGIELNSTDMQTIRDGSPPLYQYNSTTEQLSPAERFEAAWRNRYRAGANAPRKPSDGRISEVSFKADLSTAYSRLMALLAKNNVRRELKLEEYYEKPNQKRRRLKSERHRRRFAAAVREKVQLVMALQARGV